MEDKYTQLLDEAKRLSEKNEYLDINVQSELVEAIIEFAFTLGSRDINFGGENDYGHNLLIAVDECYGFRISLCWRDDSIWCFQDYGFIHPNLATVSGKEGKRLIDRVGELAYSWIMGLTKSDRNEVPVIKELNTNDSLLLIKSLVDNCLINLN